MLFGLLIELLLESVNATPVVVRDGFMVAAGCEVMAEVRAVRQALQLMRELLNSVLTLDFEKETILSITNEVFQTTDATGDHRFTGTPGFEGYDTKRLMGAREHEDIAGLEGIEETWVIIPETWQQKHGVLELVGLQGGSNSSSVVWLGFWADQDEACLRVGCVKRPKGFQERELVLLGIDPADVEDHEGILIDIMFSSKLGSKATAKLLGVNAIGQVGDATM